MPFLQAWVTHMQSTYKVNVFDSEHVFLRFFKLSACCQISSFYMSRSELWPNKWEKESSRANQITQLEKS